MRLGRKRLPEAFQGAPITPAGLRSQEILSSSGVLHSSRAISELQWNDAPRFSPQVAFSGPLNLAPWLYVIPIDLAPFKQLLVHVGVCPEFTVSQYRSLLADMAEAGGGKPLSAGQLVQVLGRIGTGLLPPRFMVPPPLRFLFDARGGADGVDRGASGRCSRRW